MQFYKKNNWTPIKIILFFAAVLLIAFLPISSFLFYLKNDAFTGYFPPKFFMSESIRDGFLPLWNPYINYGFPQYGDMSSGFMSPITWLIASTVGYNAYTFTLETLIYILIAGLGMYKLAEHWQLKQSTRIIAGIVFMCCGYQIGHLQHFNWLSGAAFFPCCVWAYLNLLKAATAKNIVSAALLFYLLISSAHPGITIGSIYFFMGITIFYFLENSKTDFRFKKKKLFGIAIFILLLLVVSIGLIVSYADIIPHFVRGSKSSFTSSTLDNSSIQSWISLLLPLSIVKNEQFFQSDLSLRNSYTGISILLFFTIACIGRKNNWQKFFLYMALFFFLLSIGGFFKNIFYKIFPLLGYVRLNGEYRIFALFSIILIGAIQLDKYFDNDTRFKKQKNILVYLFAIVLFSSLLWSVFKIISGESILLLSKQQQWPANFTGKLKYGLDHLSFYDCVLIQSLFQLFFLWQINKALNKGKSDKLILWVVIDMIIASLLVIPFTGAGKASVAQVQVVLNQSPKGIPLPNLQPVYNNPTLPTTENEYIGSWSMFSKQIGNTKEVPYPIQLKNMKAFFANTEQQNDSLYFSKPFVFIKNKKAHEQVKLISFEPCKIELLAQTVKRDTLLLQQNYYAYWSAYVNDKEVPISIDGKTFMSIPLEKGNNKVQFFFKPGKIKLALCISFIVFTTLLLCWIYLSFSAKLTSPSLPGQ